MKKIIISLMVILLMSACASYQTDQADPHIDWNGLKLTTSTICDTYPVPPAGACSNKNSIEALIQVDTNGAPIGVAPIVSCGGKHVTWEYAPDALSKGNPAPFFIVFDPAHFPGNSSYNPISTPRKDPRTGKVNQEIKINTRAKRGAHTGPSECMDYLIVVPGKGILDPVFIIKR